MAIENKTDYINVLNTNFNYWKENKVLSAHSDAEDALRCKNEEKNYPVANPDGVGWKNVPVDHIDTYERTIIYKKI